MFDFLQGLTRRRWQWRHRKWPQVTSRDLTSPDVTRKWRHLTGSHLEVAVEGL